MATNSIHAQWLGMLQPEGLVVSIPVLQDLELWTRQDITRQQALRSACPGDRLPSLDALLRWLAWPDSRVCRDTQPWRLELPDLGATLQPTAALLDKGGAPQLLLQWSAHDLDRSPPGDTWTASAQERLERLLLASGVPIGLHVSPDCVRLSYAPKGQAPGRLSFPIAALCASDGRVLVDALLMLIGPGRLFVAVHNKRLLPVLQASRTRQEAVTVALAQQVEDALRILLAGFDAANTRANGQLLQGVDREQLYEGLTTLLLRLVFLLYAEDRGLLPISQELYHTHYSVTALAEQLRTDAVRFHAAMDRRFGACSRLLTLFRLVFDGGNHHGLRLPPRKGELFDPDRFPFLEGRSGGSYRTDRATVPLVDDHTWHQVLHRLLHLEGQRISYRNLEVEQIGSIYENIMGFQIQRAAAPALALKPLGHVVDLHALRRAPRPVAMLAQLLGERTAKLQKALPDLHTFVPTDDLETDLNTLQAALGPRLPSSAARIPAGDHVLVPGPERRHSGSHYTPRSLSEPIVRHTLEPLLGPSPTPEQVLALRVCDPAMGSGAFLAESCRYLASRLVEAWSRTDTTPPAARAAADPQDVARRRVAERCLYGVDKNPRAVTLARLSLWLVTSAADQPFTFVDHALRQGDALIGLSPNQIAHFALHPGKHQAAQVALWDGLIANAQGRAQSDRSKITATQTELPVGHSQKLTFLNMAQDEIWDEVRVADLLLAAHWIGGKKSELKDRLQRAADMARSWYPNHDRDPMPHDAEAMLARLPMTPFHWGLEFPEVFARKKGSGGGFDAVVGNPPFGGKNTILASNGDAYIKLLQAIWPHGHGNADLAAWFFVRATELLRPGGCFGLVSTNTIAQGNTRETGLQHMTPAHVSLYRATVDMPWPVAGAAVTVSIVHGCNGAWDWEKHLTTRTDVGWETQAVPHLNSSLQGMEELPDPVGLKANSGQGFVGNYVLGKGFVLTPAEAAQLIQDNPDNTQIVRPYLGGQELNSDPECKHSRYVIDFAARSLDTCDDWPELVHLLRVRQKPERDRNNRKRYRDYWWQFGENRPGMRAALRLLGEEAESRGREGRCLANSQVSKHMVFAWQPLNRVFAHTLNIFALDTDLAFAVLQSCVHEPWARAMGSSMKTDLRYTPSRCFVTFPFPPTTHPALLHAAGQAGQALYDARAAIMVEHQIGMTTVWNALAGQWPKNLNDYWGLEQQIPALSALRVAMDRAVLAAYGWADLEPGDKAEILTRLRKLNVERATQEALQAR